MERSEHSLAPQWLKSSGSVSREASINSQLTSSPYSGHITYSGCQRSSSSKGYGYSRSYGSFGRSRRDRNWEKDIDNLFDQDKLVFGQRNHDHSDYVDNILANRFEKDRLQHSQSMTSGRLGGTWSGRTGGGLSNPQRNHDKKSDCMVTGIVDIMHKTVFEEEFPLLGAEDKQGGSELGRVLSSGSSASSHSLLTGTSAVIVSNGLTSALHEIPVTVGSNSMAAMLHQHTVSANYSSIAPGTMGLSMAETLAQGPPRSHTPPQLSVGTQKLEEMALKQSRLLIPMTPSMPRTLVVSPSEKSKVKTGKQQYPLYSRPPSHSPRGGPANSDLPKITSGNSRSVSASRELNGVSSAAKDSLSPGGSRVVLSPIGATTSTSINAPSRNSSNNTSPVVWTTLEKRPTLQSQSRTDFFKNLSRKSSLKSHCSDPFPTGMSCASEKSEVVKRNVTGWLSLQSGDAPPVDTSAVNSLTESSCIITGNGNASCEPSKFSSNGAQLLSTNPVLYPEEEEIAFLRSLGWEESTGEDESLTEEEIRDFCEKYMKLQPSSNILHEVHQKMITLPLDSSGGCGGAPSGLRPSA